MKIPSLELFQALQQEMNRRRNVFEGLGFIDTRCVFAVEADSTTPESHYYAVEFAVYSCERVWRFLTRKRPIRILLFLVKQRCGRRCSKTLPKMVEPMFITALIA